MYQQQSPQPHGEHQWSSSGSSYEAGYEGNFQQSDQLADAIARRLQTQASSFMPIHRSSGVTAGMRLALAIVSICMLVPLSAITLGILGTFSGLIGMGVIGVVILGVNAMFNSSR